ncbi:putative Ig domain-containing protein [Candidatus Soleaferrea massiliensis]|uniref:putative Ig domain-containing protein n=1 Tax=Candidatus Soleaferrea massiliensis TaxID=1470354 RepID=UPI00058C06F3|nr:putative Ig domain-containing protein [Candidatus Soleaferrea massiliensis]
MNKWKKLVSTICAVAMLVTTIPAGLSASAIDGSVKIEAETGYMVDRDGNRLDRKPSTDDKNASGGAYYGNFDVGQRRGLVLENVTDTKKTSIAIKYATSGYNGTFDIYLNGAKQAYKLGFTNTKGWYMDKGTTVSGCIDIPAGADIRIVPSDPANIDYIVLGDETDLPPIAFEGDFFQIEAESGYLVNRYGEKLDQKPATDDPNASGGAYYDHFDSGERKGLVLQNTSGEDKLSISIRYSSYNSGTFDIYLNGSRKARQLPFTSTGAWTMNKATFAAGRIDIPAGAEIKIVPSEAANIDYIVVGKDASLPEIPGEVVSKEQALARQMETESIVLAQNDGVLPLSTDTRVAVFGRGQLAPTTGGGGSGAVNGSYTSTFIDGLTELDIRPCQELLDYYQERVHSKTDIDHGWNTGTDYPGEWGSPVYSGTSWSQSAGVNTPDVKLDGGKILDDGIVARAAQESDVAIVYITRTTGAEEMDRIKQPGDWYLDPSEKVLLQQVTDKFDKVVAILSVNGPIDMSWVREYGIDSVLISYASGSQNGYAMADLVFGLQNPSGKLADTITETYEEHPTADTFGYVTYADMGLTGSKNNAAFGDDDPVSTYLENIYEGYRYFDTFGKDVLYPFGSGLSYSDFNFNDLSVALNAQDKSITVSATLENVTQDASVVPGKEVMEVYASIPNGKLEQPYQKLVDYQKSDVLSAGESQRMSIDIPLKDLASYDEERAAYILEPGTYYLRVGSSSRDTHIAGAFEIEDTILVEQLTNRLTLSDDAKALFEKEALSNKDAAPITYAGEAEEMKNASENAFIVTAQNVEVSLAAPAVTERSFRQLPADEPVHKFSEVQSGDISLEDFVSQMTDDELITLLAGSAGRTDGTSCYTDDTAIPNNYGTKNGGISGAGLSRNIQRFSIPSLTYADGSAGIGYNAISGVRDKNIGWPRAASVACIWNKDLIREYAVEMGKAMVDINVDIWLAPSINLHRNPLNGRNNEYYSEDPILSGITASVVAEGVAESGVTVCLKHFAGNDQEYYRRGVINDTTEKNGTSRDAINVISSERALREITLKPFEMAVKTGKVMNVMSAFNKVNGQYCASSSELLTDILRGEWGFDGFVVTDWGDFDVIAHEGQALAAGNDMNMPGYHGRHRISDQYRESLANGDLTRAQMQRSAYDFLHTLNQSVLSSMPGKHRFADNLSILSTTLPEARIGYDYAESKRNPLIASGGKGTSYSFRLAGDSPSQLPEGITLLPNGTLSGKPASGTEGSYSLKFEVIDNTGASAAKQLTLTVKGELSIQPQKLAIVKLNQPYEQKLTAVDAGCNTVDAVFTTSSKLPAGLTLSEDGTLSGTCTDIGSGSFPITVSVVSKDGAKTGSADFTLDAIANAVTITTESLTDASIGSFYSQSLAAAGGVQPYSWTVDALPEGFVFDGTAIRSGVLSGGKFIEGSVPKSAEGIYDIRVTLTDGIGDSDVKTLTLKVGSPDETAFMITTGSLPQGKVGTTYEAPKFTARGAAGRVSYSLDADSDVLPAGLTLSEDGTLSGTPTLTVSGVYRIVVKAEDEAGSTCSKAYQLYIAGQLTPQPAAYSVLGAEEQKNFNQRFTASGGYSSEYSFALSPMSDPLPAGLTLTSDTTGMTISGTPAAGTRGTYNLLVVMDAAEFGGNPVTSVIPYTLKVSPEKINLALNRPVYASSYLDLLPEWAVDGNMSSRWCSHWQEGDVDDAWLTVDLGAVYDINSAVIHWETAYASEYVLQVSDDNEHFTNVDVLGRSYDGLNHTWTISAKGRYLRMQSIKAATKWGSSIYEFQIYGTPAEAPELSITSERYTVDEEQRIISGISFGTTIEDTLAGLFCDDETAAIRIVDEAGNAVDAVSDVRSGMKAQILYGGKAVKEYALSVLGDLGVSENLGVIDLLLLKNQILGKTEFTPIQALSADMDQNGRINVLDLLRLKLMILGM